MIKHSITEYTHICVCKGFSTHQPTKYIFVVIFICSILHKTNQSIIKIVINLTAPHTQKPKFRQLR